MRSTNSPSATRHVLCQKRAYSLNKHDTDHLPFMRQTGPFKTHHMRRERGKYKQTAFQNEGNWWKLIFFAISLNGWHVTLIIFLVDERVCSGKHICLGALCVCVRNSP